MPESANAESATAEGVQEALPDSVTVIGGGVSGFTVVSQLRARGYRGGIALLDPEGVPYDRPPLSKDYLAGRQSLEELQFQPAEWFEERRIQVLSESAVRLELHPDGADPGEMAGPVHVHTSSGKTLATARVVLATGGHPRSLPVPGCDLPGVLALRNVTDADRLREVASHGHHVVVVGASLIGAEATSVLLSRGAQVTLVDPAETPLAPAVGEALAQRLHGMHADHGATVVHGAPSKIVESNSGLSVFLDNGSQVQADAVLVGIGITAADELAAEAGIETNQGILVDHRQRSSDPRVYAVGDAARGRSSTGVPVERVEHWESAMNTAGTAVASILGRESQSGQAPWFWSDRYAVHVEGVGTLAEDGTLVHRFTPQGLVQATFLIRPDGTMAGAAAVDGGQLIRGARRIIDRSLIVDAQQLADPEVSIRQIMRAAQSEPTG